MSSLHCVVVLLCGLTHGCRQSGRQRHFQVALQPNQSRHHDEHLRDLPEHLPVLQNTKALECIARNTNSSGWVFGCTPLSTVGALHEGICSFYLIRIKSNNYNTSNNYYLSNNNYIQSSLYNS